MKKILFLLIIAFNAAAQTEPCATMPAYYQQLNNDPAQHYAHAESMARTWLQNPANRKKALQKNTLIKIPVVVHVVYKNAVQNIADSMIYSQLVVLNECFRKQNANYNTTRPIFDSMGTDVEIEFCLANFDPDGNPTSGIVRKSAPANASFDPLFNMDKAKKPVFGGDTAWDNSRYLNIWLADMSIFGQAIVLGYATFPGSNPALDGVVIQYDYFGKYAKPNFLGRTTVHEVGHWLGMRHIWADDDNGQNPQNVYCDSTDFVNDTPNQGPKSQSNCDKSKNTCSVETEYWGGTDPPDMVENYMDYSSDACMTLFTKGQKARMYSFLNTDPARMAITTSTAGCNIISALTAAKAFDSFINLYPNPSDGEINIHISAAFDEPVYISIFSADGRLLKIEKMTAPFKTIDTSELPAGICFIRLNDNSHSAVKKLVITH